MPSLKLSETSEMKHDFMVAIVKDCVEHKWVKGPWEFPKGFDEKYRAIEKAEENSLPKKYRGFWGGYAYLDAEPWKEDDFTGFIRLYSPWGSGKWGFSVNGDVIDIYGV